MAKRLERLIWDRYFKLSDDEIRDICRGFGSIHLWYGFNNYNGTVQHINDLYEAVKADFPDVQDSDTFVYYVRYGESDRHSSMTMLRVSVPVEGYLSLKQEGKVGIL